MFKIGSPGFVVLMALMPFLCFFLWYISGWFAATGGSPKVPSSVIYAQLLLIFIVGVCFLLIFGLPTSKGDELRFDARTATAANVEVVDSTTVKSESILPERIDSDR